MHRCLCVDEIVVQIAGELVAAKRNATAVALASCCRRFEDPVLDALWRTQDIFVPLLGIFPGDIWSPGGYRVRMVATTIVLLLPNFLFSTVF